MEEIEEAEEKGASTVQAEESNSTATDTKPTEDQQQQHADKYAVVVTGQLMALKVHKLVLSRWRYFDTIYDSGFVESGSGEKRIHVQDLKPKAHQFLLYFMYTGKLIENMNCNSVWTRYSTRRT